MIKIAKKIKKIVAIKVIIIQIMIQKIINLIKQYILLGIKISI